MTRRLSRKADGASGFRSDAPPSAAEHFILILCGGLLDEGRERVRVVADTLEQDVSVLRRIVERFGGKMAVDCRVIEPGRVTLGEAIELLEHG